MKLERIATTLAVPVTAAGIAWLGGYNFDERNFWVAWGAAMTAAVTVLVWTFPGWKD